MADGTVDRPERPTEEISVRETFGIDTDMHVRGFASRTETVAWMHDRVAALSGRQPVSVVVEWHDVFYDLRGQAPPVRVLTDRTPLDLGSTVLVGTDVVLAHLQR